MYYNISFDLVALAIIMILIIRHCRNNHMVTPAYHLYFLLLLDSAAMTLLDVVSAFQIHYVEHFPLWSLYLLNVIFYLTQHGVLPIYAAFILKTSMPRVPVKKRRIMAVLPYIISALLIITTPFTHLIFYFDGLVYHHGILYFSLYAILGLYVFQLIVITLRHRNHIGYRKLCVSICVVTIVAVAAVVQYVTSRILTVNFGFSLGLILIHYLILNPMMIFDSTNSARKAVMLDNMQHYFESSERFSIFTVHLTNYDQLTDIYNESAMDDILQTVRSFLGTYADCGIVYRIDENAFAIRLSCNREKEDETAAEINSRLQCVWDVNSTKFYLNSYTGLIHCPEEVHTVTALLDYLSGLCSCDAENGELVCGSDLGEIEHGLKILAAVKKAVLNKSFQVYYQPVYSVAKKRITAAEALIRLFDDEIGFVPPDKFIPIAEKEGYILRIGQFVFEEVCRFYSQNRLDQYGIEYIEVNLSAVQCMQYHLAEEFLSIMECYGILPEQINLEITETSAIITNESLSSNIDVFNKNGVALSLDDYGTGYSNISYMVDIPFSYIKVDKCILWSATENQKAYVILKNTVEMAKRLNMQLIIEGVENSEHVRILRALDCEYFQGYYFSKAVCGTDFLDYVTHFRLPEGCE